MPKNKPTNGSDRAMPLIVFDEVTSEKESFKLSWTVLANLREYVAYVKDTTGKDTTPDEGVDKGIPLPHEPRSGKGSIGFLTRRY
jgi:hypothetical protein